MREFYTYIFLMNFDMCVCTPVTITQIKMSFSLKFKESIRHKLKLQKKTEKFNYIHTQLNSIWKKTNKA